MKTKEFRFRINPLSWNFIPFKEDRFIQTHNWKEYYFLCFQVTIVKGL